VTVSECGSHAAMLLQGLVHALAYRATGEQAYRERRLMAIWIRKRMPRRCGAASAGDLGAGFLPQGQLVLPRWRQPQELRAAPSCDRDAWLVHCWNQLYSATRLQRKGT
jgi:hypothetical protein